MPIKTFEIVSIDGKRFTRLGERIPHLRVDNNTAVTNVSVVNDKEAQIDFRFTISYVGVGVLKIEGRIMWDGEAKAISSQWSQTNSLPNDVFGPVLQAIFSSCMPSAVVCARDLGLPPPLPPPQIQQMKPGKTSGKDARGSMEVA